VAVNDEIFPFTVTG